MLCCGLLVGCLWSGQATAQNIHPHYRDGQLNLQVDRGHELLEIRSLEDLLRSQPQLRSLTEEYGITTWKKAAVLNDPELLRWYRIEFTEAHQVGALMEALQNLPGVTMVERVPIMKHFLTPNDISGNQYYLPLIDAEDAWDNTTGDPNIVVAIVDDAVLITHEDLQPNLWQNTGETPGNGIDDDNNGYVDDINGWDVSDNDNNPNPPASATNSNFTHGTHCAGIACAATDNGIGIAGMGWDVSLMAVKCKPNGASGPTLPDVWEGVQYAIAAEADVISMSWGGQGSSSFNQQIINTAVNNGIVCVAAAGNDDTDTQFFPAAYQNVIAVGASNSQDQKASFSNYGSYIDVMAPGVNILSTLAGSTSSYGYQSGTSMACPLVSGLCGLMLSANPNQTPAQIEQCLENGCENINAQNPNYVGQMGAGRVNANFALSCVPPAVTFDDAGITQINSPGESSCSNFITPEFTLYNFGQNTLTSVTIEYSIDNGPVNTQNWTGSLAQNASTTITLPGQNFAVGQHSILISSVNPNGQTDENPNNDELVQFFSVLPAAQSLPFTEDFESQSLATNNWTVKNPDDDITWEIFGTSGPGTGNYSARVNHYAYTSVGQRDGLITPPLDLTSYTNVQLSFKHAYRRFASDYRDSLVVLVSTDCGETYDRVYAGGGGLGFATGTIIGATSFEPTTADDWCDNPNLTQAADCIDLDLSAYDGQTILVKFETYNDYGNNIYIDNINITGTQQAAPNFTAANTVICEGETVDFQDISTINNPNSWNWNFQGGSPASSTVQNPTITYATAGTYDVTLEVNGQSVTKQDYITVTPPPDIQVVGIPDTICQSNTADLTASGANTYTWSPATGLNSTTGQQVEASPSTTTTYTVTGETSIGCIGTESYTLFVDNWSPSFSYTDNGFVGNGFEVAFTDNSAGANSWTWNFGDGGFSFDQNPTHVFSSAGDYEVSLTVSNGTCDVTLWDTISVGLPTSRPDFQGGQWALYPNPAAQQLTLEIPKDLSSQTLEVALLNLQGQQVWAAKHTQPNTERLQLNLPELPSGVYIFQATTADADFRQRLFLQRR